MIRKKLKVLMLLDNCSAHHVNAHLKAVEVLFLPPNTTTKLQPMDKGVIANFKVHYRRRVIEHLLIDVHTADNVAGMKVPLVKAIFFASGACRDVKRLTLCLGLSHMDFVFAYEDLVATEDFTTEEVAGSVMEKTGGQRLRQRMRRC
ncbi:tigger transposable element-derived protein 6-like [Dermacentor albipictus]|uniref:tigger transposable element-derived protein 6-like n=1 Tax=Dermacentor albipictus TaxID=60249 RepID=UPI0031FC2232